jgi:DNA-binding transcriptional regulator YiaG
MKTTTLKNYWGFEYITVTNVPYETSAHGKIIDSRSIKDIDWKVTLAILKHRAPIRGREFRFLRKSLSFSLAECGKHLSLSATALMKWEKMPEIRLAPINEAAVRAFFAERFRIPLSGKWSELVANPTRPKRISLKAA